MTTTTIILLFIGGFATDIIATVLYVWYQMNNAHDLDADDFGPTFEKQEYNKGFKTALMICLVLAVIAGLILLLWL